MRTIKVNKANPYDKEKFMTNISAQYQGQLRCNVSHEGNGHVIETDAPKDNNGLGSKLSPTDLIASGLISCMITVMGIEARKRRLEAFKAEGSVEKKMQSSPRRILSIAGNINVSGVNNDDDRHALKQIAIACPVALSLHEKVEQHIDISFT